MVLHKLVKFHYQTVYFPSCSVKYEKLKLYYLKNKKSFQSEKKGSPLKLQKNWQKFSGYTTFKRILRVAKMPKITEKKLTLNFASLLFFVSSLLFFVSK